MGDIAGHWSYTGDPARTNRDWVRDAIGDVYADDPQLSNEEIDQAITHEGSKQFAAAMCCERIAARYARKVTQSVGTPTSVTNALSALFEHYAELAIRLRERAAFAVGPVPYAGGISLDDKETVEDDTDRVEPAFKIGMFQNE